MGMESVTYFEAPESGRGGGEKRAGQRRRIIVDPQYPDG